MRLPIQIHHIRIHIRIGCSAFIFKFGKSINEATSSVLSKESITTYSSKWYPLTLLQSMTNSIECKITIRDKIILFSSAQITMNRLELT